MNGNKFDGSDGRDDTEGFLWAKYIPKVSVGSCFLFLELKLSLAADGAAPVSVSQMLPLIWKLRVLHLSATVTPRRQCSRSHAIHNKGLCPAAGDSTGVPEVTGVCGGPDGSLFARLHSRFTDYKDKGFKIKRIKTPA